jgi:hypothetical protein
VQSAVLIQQATDLQPSALRNSTPHGGTTQRKQNPDLSPT